jgi:ring-1,2-phenylacetyl-CoA epoxidase subunit PaaE
VLLASGSGITPIMGTLKTILRRVPKSSVQLFYGNKDTESIIFREELEDLKNKYLGRLTVHYILSRQDQESEWFNGRLDIEKLNRYARVFFDPAEVDGFFICGPQPMLLSLRQGLLDLGVDKHKVHVELFNAYVESDRKKEEEWEKVYEGKAAKVDITVDGKTMSFVLPYGGKTVLDGALAKGADLPFACKGGVCCTCKAKLMEGEVAMTVNYGLEEDEIENGYILTCQSHPRSEHLIVDFDQ